MGKMTTRTTTLGAAIADAFSVIDELQQELQDWMDNMPENLQQSEKASQLQEAIDGLTQSNEPEVPEGSELAEREVKYTSSLGKRASRSDRRHDACAMIQGAMDLLTALVEAAEKDGRDDDAQELQTLNDELQQAYDEWDAVEFPGARG